MHPEKRENGCRRPEYKKNGEINAESEQETLEMFVCDIYPDPNQINCF